LRYRRESVVLAGIAAMAVILMQTVMHTSGFRLMWKVAAVIVA
jgi:hypothetical protein